MIVTIIVIILALGALGRKQYLKRNGVVYLYTPLKNE